MRDGEREREREREREGEGEGERERENRRGDEWHPHLRAELGLLQLRVLQHLVGARLVLVVLVAHGVRSSYLMSPEKKNPRNCPIQKKTNPRSKFAHFPPKKD